MDPEGSPGNKAGLCVLCPGTGGDAVVFPCSSGRDCADVNLWRTKAKSDVSLFLQLFVFSVLTCI